eukprot:7482352-Pyramimonas_sp.AAC.2
MPCYALMAPAELSWVRPRLAKNCYARLNPAGPLLSPDMFCEPTAKPSEALTSPTKLVLGSASP